MTVEGGRRSARRETMGIVREFFFVSGSVRSAWVFDDEGTRGHYGVGLGRGEVIWRKKEV